MGELEVGQLWRWNGSGDIFKVLDVSENNYHYTYVVGTQDIIFSTFFKDHKSYIERGSLYRLTPLMEALL
jgi:hypothetical protein